MGIILSVIILIIATIISITLIVLSSVYINCELGGKKPFFCEASPSGTSGGGGGGGPPSGTSGGGGGGGPPSGTSGGGGGGGPPSGTSGGGGPMPTPDPDDSGPVGPKPAPVQGDYGFTCEIPNVDSIFPNPDTTSSADVCKKYENAGPDSTENISLKEIAESWLAAGGSMEYCPAALIIAAGECQQPSGTEQGCTISGTGASGLWQVDSARDTGSNLYNPCVNAKAVQDQIIRPEDSYDTGCYTGENGSVNPPLTMHSGGPNDGGVGGSDSVYWNTSGASADGTTNGNCNWLGPFCHWQTNRNGGEYCCAWTGGGNSYQPSGFPYYYMKRFLENVKADGTIIDIPTCGSGVEGEGKSTPTECKQLAEMAMQYATDICNS